MGVEEASSGEKVGMLNAEGRSVFPLPRPGMNDRAISLVIYYEAVYGVTSGLNWFS
jgi:hypothetical protein